MIKNKELGIQLSIAALFAACIAVMTYPLVFRLWACIPGSFTTDESYAVVWNAWFIKYSFLHHLSIQNTDLIAYPFGVELYSINQLIGYLFFVISYFLSVMTTPALTYNIQILMNFALNILCMYALVRYLTRRRTTAVFSAVIFGFCPYMFARAWQHLGETYLWPLPLFVLCALRLREDGCLKNSIWLILSICAVAINFDILYYVLVTIAVLYAWGLFSKMWIKDPVYLKKLTVALAIASALIVYQFLPVIKNVLFPPKAAPSAFNIYHRPFEDLFTQSAKPLSYLIPAAVHPLFGGLAQGLIGSPLYGVSFTEHTLYLGWIPLIMAFIAIRRRRKDHTEGARGMGHGEGAGEAKSFYIGFFMWLAIVAWLFSQPPYFTFPYFKIYMPSFFMYKILPMFRAYCRFGIVVMFSVAVLAGFGLKYFLERFKNDKIKIAATSLFCGLVLFEFLNFPPFKIIDLTKYPVVYDWLKEQKGDFAIAEYPLDVQSPNEYYKLCQITHQKKMINSTRPGSYANKVSRTIWKLSEPGTPEVLSWMKVKYVIVHLNSYGKSNDMEIVNELEKIRTRNIAGLRFVKDFDGVDVYEVTAQAREPQIKNE